MAISLRSILKNVASENYDKGNIAVFLLLNAIYGGLMFSMMANMGNKQTLTALYAIVMLLILVTISGSIGVATHNAINRKKGGFPNVIKDFGLIISTISKTALGGLGVGIILFLISLIPIFIIAFITGFSVVGIQNIGSSLAGGLIVGYIICFIFIVKSN